MSGRGHFFAIDVPTFDAVCAMDDPDAAAAYIVLAAGTGPDNRTSSWASEAINRRTNLNWRKANDAIARLESAGRLRWISGKGTRKPRIDLAPVETRECIRYQEREAVDAVRNGKQLAKSRLRDAVRAIDLGWLTRDELGELQYIDTRQTALAWLPKSLVGNEDGVPIEGETTLVERVRKARDAMAFHLLVHMALRQDLAENGGIDRAMLRYAYKRKTASATAQLQVWIFTRGTTWLSWTSDTEPHRIKGEAPGADYFERVKILEDVGALEWVNFIAEDDAPDSSLIFPVDVIRHGKSVAIEPEAIVGSYATAAACALADQVIILKKWEDSAPIHYILPVDKMNRKAALVGIPRLRGRARTRNAARWHAERAIACKEWIETFRGIIAVHAPEVLMGLDQRFADFNVEFNVASTIPQSDFNDTKESSMHGSRPSDGAIDVRKFGGL
jgi:hypothetical protein